MTLKRENLFKICSISFKSRPECPADKRLGDTSKFHDFLTSYWFGLLVSDQSCWSNGSNVFKCVSSSFIQLQVEIWFHINEMINPGFLISSVCEPLKCGEFSAQTLECLLASSRIGKRKCSSLFNALMLTLSTVNI